ncbi:GNAT family N-acetyltransferase [Salipiger mangrovisoli]|uniref:L-ornithine N(alpha)-acyltransferase n=1 Tax=Salipiger mangrovisoli TaxID=2865933 RepID=A0ABR9X3J1_9RHOB|nr:GNAT family N-acyltransferase [Salipiger mangrovisoli]MBE9638154.1 GNAT family N-acetyltransferase [Salipiger mangrovisoli]
MSPASQDDAAGTGGALLSRGRFRARLAQRAADLDKAQVLRGLAFFGPGGGPDTDPLDQRCRHVLIEDDNGLLLCCFRYLWFDSSAEIGSSYSAQYYDLSRLEAFGGPLIELGRFCTRPGMVDPDVLRLAWGAIAALVDGGGARLLFGCASFAGTEPARYDSAFGFLHARHAAPERWQIGVKAGEVVRFRPAGNAARGVLKQIPPLLRTYLGMGGWVSDHAVVDRQMNTLHVFTGVETAGIPPARTRALRAIAG